MSKLGSILQPRTLPPPPQNILFSDCNPEVPAIFNVLLKSWQNTGTRPIVNVPLLIETAAAEARAEQAQSEPGVTSNEVDCPGMSHLAAEWQVGIETLDPLNVPVATAKNAFTKVLDTVTDTTQMVISIGEEAGLEVLSRDSSVREVISKPSASTTYLAGKLIEAVQNGTASTVEQVLRLINNQFQSTVAVLLEIKETFAKTSSTPLSVDWETGWDTNGKSFTRISFSLLNDCSQGSGATKLVIGSDGTTYATFKERWNSTPLYLSPNDALAKIKGSNFKRPCDFNKAPLRAPQPTTEFRSWKAPRHFKAAG